MGANINGVDVEAGETCLHLAATYDYDEVAREALKLGANVRSNNCIPYLISFNLIYNRKISALLISSLRPCI